jgi:hypothetical protein
MKEAVPFEVDCDVTGGIASNLIDSEWDSVVVTFQPIVNLAYVHTGEDHIFFDSFKPVQDSREKTGKDRRDLRNHRNYRRGRPGFRATGNRNCGSCNRVNLSSDGARYNIYKGYGWRALDGDGVDGDMPFDQFVNKYLAGVITGMFQYRTPAGAPPVEANCTFS